MPDDFTRLTWVMLPLILDRCGRGIDNANWVRSKMYPMREDVMVEQMQAALDWYAEHGMIERYTVNDNKYFWIPTWHLYQGNTSRESESVLPEPDGYDDYETDESRDWISETIRHFKHRPGIYIITCSETGKCYVGASEDIYSRIRTHLRALENDDQEHPMIGDFRSYGRDSISINIYCYVDTMEELKAKEQQAIDEFGPDLYNTNDARWHWKWQQRSRSGHAAVTQRSGSDSDVDADVDSDVDTDSEQRTPTASFQDWHRQVETAENRPAALRAMFEALYPGRDPPSFAYLGKVAKAVGGAGRLAELLWEHSTKPPTGDVLAYIQAAVKKSKRAPPDAPQTPEERRKKYASQPGVIT
jgi:hypothetical protein